MTNALQSFRRAADEAARAQSLLDMACACYAGRRGASRRPPIDIEGAWVAALASEESYRRALRRAKAQ